MADLRHKRGITLKKNLAAGCHFEKSNLSRIEYVRSNMTIATLLTISRALGVR
ncbi:MAG TPA: helix-turn-helix domain-containing protein [Candidatus Rikenella faecigallinarum]|uniref:Helix-turn-helix domain-containing protein n=1 Tax=Candidatus Rikenella faecigallinarum TaxID=2838745 RepID=A0A9D1TYH1_9BACT|nr:helix-turn-helix domain-containing protein [Candidatus Rikenella faecigallinarum]